MALMKMCDAQINKHKYNATIFNLSFLPRIFKDTKTESIQRCVDSFEALPKNLLQINTIIVAAVIFASEL